MHATKKKKAQGKQKKTLPDTLLLKFKYFRQSKGKKKPKEKRDWEGPEQTSLARAELTVRPHLQPARAARVAPRRAAPRHAARPAPPRPAPAPPPPAPGPMAAPTPHPLRTSAPTHLCCRRTLACTPSRWPS